ncbi:cytochrome P450 [Nocardia jinanensis]|uniref:Cytochrome P450 n=1 Tax=Nocardia jinanensis TaxID=382504 RepID=A0A917RNG6_9NOCA|nr:cytochrome P450 [Nocardia jinanensis]GGL16067.1 cytochrome P450 [Nocardia jinanensis]
MTRADIPIEELRASHRRDYDPYHQVPIAEQLAELADRRETVPVSYSARGNGCWVLTRYDDIAGVLRRSNRGFISFPNDPDGINSTGADEGMIPIELDGPRHRQFRVMLDPAFSPKRVAQLEDGLREWANRLIDDWIGAGECDFNKGFALPFPGVTVMKIMGWPEEDLDRLYGWVDIVMHGVPGVPEDEANAARGKAHGEIREYMFALIAERRAAPPREDVTSAALAAEIDGKKLSDSELFDLFLLMMLAGLDTVQSVLGQAMVHLARNPEQWDQMFESTAVLNSAVEEFLRWGTPPVPTRTIVDDEVQVGAVTLPKGERVHFPLAVANRDPSYYENPDDVIVDRFVDMGAKPHVAFGLGPHRCVGVHLARLELRIAFQELRRRLPKFELAADRIPQEHLGLAWGVDNIHLRFEPGTRELT